MGQRRATDPLAEEIVDLLRDVNRALHERLTEHARESGVRHFFPLLPLLHVVIDDPGVTVNELARRLGMAKSQMSTLVARLERESLLRKEDDPDDRRLKRIHATPEAKRLTRRWKRQYRSALTETVRSLSPNHARELVAGLRALRAALASAAERHPGATS